MSNALNDAIANRDAARNAYSTAKTSKARNLAAEELEFWMGRVAMLTAKGGW